MKTKCLVPDCSNPRFTTEKKTYPRCEYHQRKFWALRDETNRCKSNEKCAVKDCPNPRQVTRSGFVYSRCAEHVQTYSAPLPPPPYGYFEVELSDPPPVTDDDTLPPMPTIRTCCVPNCTQPRKVSESGYVYSRCEHHIKNHEKSLWGYTPRPQAAPTPPEMPIASETVKLEIIRQRHEHAKKRLTAKRTAALIRQLQRAKLFALVHQITGD